MSSGIATDGFAAARWHLKSGSAWTTQVVPGKNGLPRRNRPALPLRSPSKPVGLQLLETAGCAGRGEQQTEDTNRLPGV